MLKRLTLLAMSVAALVAFAVPATASAGWTSNGAPLETHTIVKLTGHFQWDVFSAVGATAETVHAELTLEPGSTAKVLKFETTNCVALFGYFRRTCHVTTPGLKENPWVVHCNSGGTSTITNVHQEYRWTGTNPPANSTLQGNMTATPDNKEAITKFSLSSAGATVNGLPATIASSLNVDAEHAGKIGCV